VAQVVLLAQEVREVLLAFSQAAEGQEEEVVLFMKLEKQ
jgi:hypothetical protein